MSMWRKRDIASQLLACSGLGAIMRLAPRWREGLLIFNYHRIGDPRGTLLDRCLWSASTESFERHVRFLKHHCRIISPADLLDESALAGQPCAMITFDDGYRDNYDIAFPILRSLEVPATFFVTTGFMDHPRVPWWDEIAWMVRNSTRDRVGGALLGCEVHLGNDRQAAVETLLAIYKKLPGDATDVFMEDLATACGTGRCPSDVARDLWMTWDMLRELRDAGMTIGGHTVDHPILSRLSPFQQEEQICGCMDRLEQELRPPRRFLAYPRGKQDSYNEATRAALYQAHIELAFSYYGGFNHFGGIDPYNIKRVPVELAMPEVDFEAIVSMPGVFS